MIDYIPKIFSIQLPILRNNQKLKLLPKITKQQMIVQDVPHELEFSLKEEQAMLDLNKNDEYEPAQMLVWKRNTSNNLHITDQTGSLTDVEKRALLDVAIRNLRIVLDARSSSRTTTTTTIPDSDAANVEFTFRALQTTVDILSSSYNSL